MSKTIIPEAGSTFLSHHRTDTLILSVDRGLQGSLFNRINEADSTVEVLAGSRKFIEGWNSWRVSNMGLLNIGKTEGSQIIQLFGRGVRLRGRGMSLKRSSAVSDERHPDYIQLLETLNIFALRANYMAQFQDYLESEGINTDDLLELSLCIKLNQNFLNKGLVIPRLDEGSDFAGQETVLLQHDPVVGPVSVAMSTTADQLSSRQPGIVSARSGMRGQIPLESLELVDWSAVYLAMLEYKQTRGFTNLLIQPNGLQTILAAGEKVYLLEAEESVFNPRTHDNRQRLQEAVTNILRKYADTLYRHRQARWESSHMTYRKLDDTDPNFQFNIAESGTTGRYIVRVPRVEEQLAHEIEHLIEDCNALYQQDQDKLPRVHFDRHLYQPLLVQENNVTSSPPGLNDSEYRFVADLRAFCATAPTSLPVGTELFLLRNLTRGKGVGFFESNDFYPDFILWVKSDDRQRIVFVEPHGMLNQKAYRYDRKAKLHKRLPALAREMASRSADANVELDSFIVSATPYENLKERYGEGQWTREDFAAKHILFPDDEQDYLRPIIGF